MVNDQNWYIAYKKNPLATIRLFCFHHAGGGASAYYPWIGYLSSHIEMIAIQFPGRENRFTEPLNNNINDIITQLSEGFNIYKNKPFLVFGHSLGALITYEFVKSINKLYTVYPQNMIISATKAPHLPFKMKHLSHLDNKDLIEELKVYNGIDERMLNNDEHLELFLPIIRNDFSIYENYRFSESNPFPCDILALSGAQDKTVTQEEILEWSAYTAGSFKHLSFPGTHFFINNNQKCIIEIINQIGIKHP